MQDKTQLMPFSSVLEDPALAGERENVPHLSERMLVDLVNGLEVSKDQLTFKASQSRLSRFIGAVDGSNRRRDILIAERHQDALEGLQTWVLELTCQERLSKEALTHTIRRLDETRKDLMAVASVVLQHENRLAALENTIERFENRLLGMEERLQRIEAKDAIEMTIADWRSGRIHKGYATPVRLAFLIDDLMTGPFGPNICCSTKLENYLSDQIVGALVGAGRDQYPDKPMPMHEWLSCLEPEDPTKRATAGYLLGIDAERTPVHYALARAASGQVEDPGWLDRAIRESLVPGTCRPERFTGHLVREAKEWTWN